MAAGAGGADRELVREEPEDRLVILARTLDAQDDRAARAASGPLGETCLGHALYRHDSIFRGSSDAPAGSHLALSYFRGFVPAEVIRAHVFDAQPVELLRAEILVTTPGSFLMPAGWQGLGETAARRASLEYIDVRPAHLATYRDLMRRAIGPAAARLVARNEIGTFRAMETACILYHHPALRTHWNQIHLCEVDPEGFTGFGDAFASALREVAPDGGFAALFAGLDAIRDLPRWTFNRPIIEADAALGRAREG